MGTVTKTITENINHSGGLYATWTVSVSGSNNITLSSSTFTASAPTVSAKYVGSNKGYASANITIDQYIPYPGASGVYVQTGECEYRYGVNMIALASNTTKALTRYGNSITQINTSAIFNQYNRTTKTQPVYCEVTWLDLVTSNASQSYSSEYFASGTISFGQLYTITLDAPPTVTYDPPTYATPQYAGLGSYSIDVTQAKAQYQGYVSSITLTIGTDSTTQTYAATTVTNQTLSVTPTVAGTYTPTLKVTDSRGQTTTASLPQITVNPYNAPSLDFDVFRTDSDGVRDDEGAYGLVTANISFTDAVADITEPTVQINGTTTSNVTWYSAYNASTGVSSAISDWSTVSSGDTVYGLINGSFSQTDSYQITITLEDSLGGTSSAITQTLSTAFYTIDFQAGGKEISFGGPANDTLTTNQEEVGLFKCGMEAAFNSDAVFNEEMHAQANKVFIDSTIDPTQIPAEGITDRFQIIDVNGDRVASFHAQQLSSSGTIGAGFNANRIVNGTNIINGIMFNISSNGTRVVYLNDPQAFRDALGIEDFVVERGASGIWTYRKWNSGVAECWGKYSGSIAINTTSAGYGGYRSAEITTPTFPITFSSAPSVTATANSAQGYWVNNISSQGTTNAKFYLSSGTSLSAGTRYVAFHVIGRWK